MTPKRIVCLTEEYVEFLYLLGEEDRIVGISSYVKRPSNAIKEKPIVSSFVKVNVEKINQLKPDLILGFSDLQAEVAKELIQNHHHVFIANPRSIEDIFQILYWLGLLIDQKEKTETLIQRWKNKLEFYAQEAKKFPTKHKVFFMEWDEPIISGITWVEELLEILNTQPLFPELKTKKSAKERIVPKEEILARNPDVIINCWCGKKTNFDWVKENFSSTNAVKNQRIYEIEPEVILQPGPALFEEGVDKLFELIYKN
ncbi:MAG: ABC transporter substrate-binding protein [Leptospiraceae bacterium]|nr:ABC transporter substrate-binding protein [Leptospiraceae bacterium]MDW7974987.1 ABC transporter substrate-binding protein [Leptospiraceae bacterium]